MLVVVVRPSVYHEEACVCVCVCVCVCASGLCSRMCAFMDGEITGHAALLHTDHYRHLN